jgi:hypothetical protein
VSAYDELGTAASCLEGAVQAIQRARVADDAEYCWIFPHINRADEKLRDATAQVRLALNRCQEVGR